MARVFFGGTPRKDQDRDPRRLLILDHYARRTRPSANWPLRLGCLLRGCLQIVVLVVVCGLVAACVWTYMLLVAFSG